MDFSILVFVLFLLINSLKTEQCGFAQMCKTIVRKGTHMLYICPWTRGLDHLGVLSLTLYMVYSVTTQVYTTLNTNTVPVDRLSDGMKDILNQNIALMFEWNHLIPFGFADTATMVNNLTFTSFFIIYPGCGSTVSSKWSTGFTFRWLHSS